MNQPIQLVSKSELIRQRLQALDSPPMPERFKNMSLVLKLTNRCNLACAYCYTNSSPKAKGDMDFVTAQHAIDMSLAGTDGPVNVLFHGGEPLLRLDLIQSIVDHYGDRVSYSMQTNATLITQERAEYFKAKNIHIGISIDGPPDVHDKWRVYGGKKAIGSYKQVERGIRFCKERGIPVGIYAVVTRDSLHRLPQIAEMLRDLEIYNFAVEIIDLNGRGSDKSSSAPTPEEYFEAKKELIEWLIEHNRTAPPGKRMSERTNHWMLHNIQNKTRGFMCLKAPCGAGQNHIGIGTSGEVFVCDKFIGHPEYIVGNVHDEIPLEKQVLEHPTTMRFLQRTAGKMPFCKSCNLRSICSQGCAAMSYFDSGDIYSHPPLCSFYKKIYPYLISKLAEGIPAEMIS